MHHQKAINFCTLILMETISHSLVSYNIYNLSHLFPLYFLNYHRTIFGTEIKTQLKVHFSHNFQYMQPTPAKTIMVVNKQKIIGNQDQQNQHFEQDIARDNVNEKLVHCNNTFDLI